MQLLTFFNTFFSQVVMLIIQFIMEKIISIDEYVSLCSTEAVISSTAIFNNTVYGSKLYIFLLCQKSLDIKIMFHEDISTINVSKRNFWLVICIAKNLIWTTIKMIFSIFRFFCILRFQIYKYCPNHTSMEILFIHLSDDAYISISQKTMLMTGFVLHSHIYG